MFPESTRTPTFRLAAEGSRRRCRLGLRAQRGRQWLHVTASKWLLGSTHVVKRQETPASTRRVLDADDGDGAAPHERAPVHLSPHVHPPRIPETCPFLSHFISRFAHSLSSPNKRAFLVLDNEDPSFFFPPSPFLPFLPFSYFLDCGHDPLDVIFRPAPGLGSDRPARHCRGGDNIFKARRQFRHNANSRAHRGSSAPARPDGASQRGAWLQLHREGGSVSPLRVRVGEQRGYQTAWIFSPSLRSGIRKVRRTCAGRMLTLKSCRNNARVHTHAHARKKGPSK